MPETLPVREQPDGTLVLAKLPGRAAKPLEEVRSAIDRIKTAKARLLVVERDPYSNADDHAGARNLLREAELELAYQWENVDVLLVAMLTAVEACD